MTSSGQRKEIQNNVFQIPNKSRITRRDSRKDNIPWTSKNEKKWWRTHNCTLEGKWCSTATQTVNRFEESGHPVFKSISALSRGVLKRKNNRNTTHFTADAPNTELLYGTIHSAKQLSICGAVAYCCEEFCLKPNETSARLTKTVNDQLLNEVKPQEITSLVQTPRNDERASGKILRERIQNFETLEREIQFTRVCENGTFFRGVSVGMCYKTVADEDDGFGDRTPACRAYTHPRLDSNSRVFAAILRTNSMWTSSSSSFLCFSWHSWK